MRTHHLPDENSSPKPTRTRYRVVGFALAFAAITYLDRVCISVLAPSIMRDLSLSKIEMGYVFSAFTLAYGLFEIPTAWWADRIGTRQVLTRIVVWWSAFTVMTAAAFNYSSLLVLRFLFGAGEAGAWPSAARMFSRWIPSAERGRVQGIFFGAAHLSGGLVPILIGYLAMAISWRAIFVVCGCIGFIWAYAWFNWFRDEPADHPEVNAAELAYIDAGRPDAPSHHGDSWIWRALVRPNIAALCLMYFSNVYGFFFLITWLPTYLEQHRGFQARSLAWFAGLPLILSVAADLSGGVVTDWAARSFGLRFGRAVIGGIAYLVAGVSVIGAALTSNSVGAAVLIAVAAAASMFTLAASWATCIDIGGAHAGVVSAAMNTMGQVGGFLSPIILAYSVEKFANWAMPLYLMGGLYFLSAACWCVVDPCQPLMVSAAAGQATEAASPAPRPTNPEPPPN